MKYVLLCPGPRRGQVIPLEDGAREKCRTWGVRVPLKERGPKGRRREHYETLYNTTPLKAEKRRDELLAQVGAGLFRRPAPTLFSALAAEWLEQKRREGKRPKSLDTYGDVCKAYLLTHLGHLRLKELTPLAVRNLFNALQDRGLSTVTVRYARTVLNLILKDAVAWGYLGENPAQNIFATLQYLAGERDRVISDLMGRKRTDFTKEVYTKVLP